jgi:hypothetical protein
VLDYSNLTPHNIDMKEILRETWGDLSLKLENILQESWDQEARPAKGQTFQQKFELQVNFHGIESISIGLPTDHIEKVVAVFKRTCPYFQFGLLLENRDQKFSPVAFFNEGSAQVASGAFHDLKLSLPTTNHLQVLTTPGSVFVKKLKLSWDPENKCKAYLVRPTADFAFILFSPVPDLWMQDHMAALVKEFKKIFTV